MTKLHLKNITTKIFKKGFTPTPNENQYFPKTNTILRSFSLKNWQSLNNTQEHKSRNLRLVWGFTLLEVLIVIGVIAILATLIVPVLIKNLSAISIDSDAKIMMGVLRDAQQRAITSEQGEFTAPNWGVCFFSSGTPNVSYYEIRSNITAITAIAGNFCNDGTTVARYNFSNGVILYLFKFLGPLNPGTLSPFQKALVFTRITGAVTGNYQITIQSGSESRIIKVDLPNGTVSYCNPTSPPCP